MTIESRFNQIRDRVEAAAERSGRPGSSVRIIAVSKHRTVEEIEEALRAGVMEIAENRVQEADHKHRLLKDKELIWHLVGHLQGNKVKYAVQMFDWIHSLDSVKLAERIDRLAAEIGKRQRVLVQVDLAGEETKSGLPAAGIFEDLEKMGKLEHLSVEGFMVLPPFLPDTEDVRPYFSRLRDLRDEARKREIFAGPLAELSMGMTHDFEVAIEEGATMVRIGTALFGERPSNHPTLTQSGTLFQEERNCKLTPLDIQRQSFQNSFRGFDRDEVRTYLNVVAEEMEQLRSENERLQEDARRQSQLLAEHHEREQILKNTLVAAQRTSEEIKENAKKQSQMVLKEAELAADRLVEAAQSKAHSIEKDIIDLKHQKRQMLNSILTTIGNLRSLIQSMHEAEAQQDKVSFLKRRSATPEKSS